MFRLTAESAAGGIAPLTRTGKTVAMLCRPAAAQSIAPALAAANDRHAGVIVAQAAPLEAIERRVVLMSRGDPRPVGRLGRAMARAARVLFGGHATVGLADPRLEALRRFAVTLRLAGGAVARGDIDRFVAAGFGAAQIATVWALCGDGEVTRSHPDARSRRLRLIG